MSVSLISQSRSYSARSISGSSTRSIFGSSAISLSGGMQLVGAGQTRISTGPFQSRAPSMYGGAGGYGTRISQCHSDFSSGLLTLYGGTAVIDNEKATMQNLNDRLASYLEEVHSLETANRKLELQIREFYEKRAPSVSKDFAGYLATIAELQAQHARKSSENHIIILQMENAQMAAEDFKIKYEMELNMHSMVEADVSRLRGVRDSLTLAISDLEVQIEGLKEDLLFIKKNHEEEKLQLRIQQTGTVNVEVDSADSVDLTNVLQEMRAQYEALVLKNKEEIEKWFKIKMDSLQTQISICTKEGKTFYTQLSELKRTRQSLEITRESIITEIQCLQQNMEEVKTRFSTQLSQLQLSINTLETELKQLRVSLEQQQVEYNLLETEITQYRRLLDGELHEKIQYEQKQPVVISKIVEVIEHKPHIKRVKTIVEEIVDGKVVSSSADTQEQEVQ